jgi:hypothetical protein
MSCLLALTSLTPALYAQGPTVNVTTWHNDINRTGWQYYETTLTPSSVQSNFGLLWEWPVTGHVYAQPLAVAGVNTNVQGCQPCDRIFVATEQDWLYAFNATSPSSTAVWSVNLASQVGGTAIDCTVSYPATPPPCKTDGSGTSPVGRYVGVTGTPVIDTSTNTLYAVAAVYFTTSSSAAYYLFAVNIASHTVQSTPIAGTVNGFAPTGPGSKCTSTYRIRARSLSIPITFSGRLCSCYLLAG